MRSRRRWGVCSDHGSPSSSCGVGGGGGQGSGGHYGLQVNGGFHPSGGGKSGGHAGTSSLADLRGPGGPLSSPSYCLCPPSGQRERLMTGRWS